MLLSVYLFVQKPVWHKSVISILLAAVCVTSNVAIQSLLNTKNFYFRISRYYLVSIWLNGKQIIGQEVGGKHYVPVKSPPFKNRYAWVWEHILNQYI